MTNMLKVIVEKVGHVGDYKAEQIKKFSGEMETIQKGQIEMWEIGTLQQKRVIYSMYLSVDLTKLRKEFMNLKISERKFPNWNTKRKNKTFEGKHQNRGSKSHGTIQTHLTNIWLGSQCEKLQPFSLEWATDWI